MHTLIIGHRGVGKTSLLKRLQAAFPPSVCLCLDAEIEKLHGPIKDIFKTKGETHFRELEKQVFVQLLSRFTEKVRPVYIALGAGFEGELPKDWEVLHLQRDLPVDQFLFPDRPNLSADGLRMPKDKFDERSRRYKKLATQELVLLEGKVDVIPEEKLFFGSGIDTENEAENDVKIRDLGGIETLMPYQVKNPEFKYWARRRIQWGLKAFELRDDLLSTEEIEGIISLLPKENLLFSFRKKEMAEAHGDLATRVSLVDWPMEFGEIPPLQKNRAFYSLHSGLGDFDKHLAVLEKTTGPLKWSPFVENVQQLKAGHEWQKKSPSERSFLPRSIDGRWTWYRLFMKEAMPINFFREGSGSSPDQPTLLQWLSRSKNKKFAAILGAPVKQSWTPLFHREFFKSKNMDTLAVDLTEAELDKKIFAWLESLGFKAFAVTSPHKKWAGELVKAEKPLNTLVWHPKKFKWEGFNTDVEGFRALVQDLLKESPQGEGVAVWGGGGVLDSLKPVLPQASYYCTRKGAPREGQRPLETPKYVIWAAGNKNSASKPPQSWKPEAIYDLSYTPDSLGIEYSSQIGARYVSGASMFVAQALKQQEIWNKIL